MEGGNGLWGLFERGSGSLRRTSESASLRSRSKQLLSQRIDLAAQLGASLYEETKGDGHLRAGREALYDGIAAIDDERAGIDAKLAELAREAERTRRESETYPCIYCGARVSAAGMFCTSCGKPVADTLAHYAMGGSQEVSPGQSCPQCGAPMMEGDRFCMSCGWSGIDESMAGGGSVVSAEDVSDAGLITSED